MAFNMISAMGKRVAAAAPNIVMIDIDNLVPNPKNFYRVSGEEKIEKQNEQLKATIEMYGVEQPLIVKAGISGQYSITAGERRYLACRRLVDEGKEDRRMVPCIIKQPQSGEDEQIELIITNHHRDKDLSEKIEEVHQLTELLQKKKNRGEKVPGRLQDIIADCLNISKSEVGRLQQIDKNLQPELKEAIKKQDLAMTPAVELSKLSPADQKAVYEKTGGKVKVADVKKYQKEQPEVPKDTYVDGFEPMLTPQKQEKSRTVNQELVRAVEMVQIHLEKELEKYAEQLRQARENKNKQGIRNLEAVIQYIGVKLIPKIQKDLLDMRGE